jgi:hypothetical protein
MEFLKSVNGLADVIITKMLVNRGKYSFYMKSHETK